MADKVKPYGYSGKNTLYSRENDEVNDVDILYQKSLKALDNFVVAITTSATPDYSAKDNIGGKLTIEDVVKFTGDSAVIRSILLSDKSMQSLPVDVVFFSEDPSATTFTDNAALTIADADLLKIIGVVSITAVDYKDFADNSIAVVSNINLPIKSTTKDIYACLVARDTINLASTSDYQLTIVVEH